MNFITVRNIDKLGRILIPVDMRNFYGFYAGTPIVIREEKEKIIISRLTFDNCTDVKIKKIDNLGRIVIPKSVRDRLKIEENKSVEILPCEDGIHLYLK